MAEAQLVMHKRENKVFNRTYEGWSEYDVKEKAWEILLLDGQKFIKKDFKGTFMSTSSGREKTIGELFPYIRNCTDSQGFIIAKRKRLGQPLWRSDRRIRVPRK